jgi:hypothetical protein
MATLATIHLLRNNFGANWFFGSCPPEMELPGYAILWIITLACAGCTCVVFSSSGRLRKTRWMLVGAITVLLVGLTVLGRGFVPGRSPTNLLQSIARIEQQGTTDSQMKQQISVLLAMCGRDSEAESISRPIVDRGKANLQTSTSPPIDISTIHPLPWRETFTKIANQHQLIIMMEAHHVPKHRQWIEQTLPILRDAGFRDYAAESLSESGRSLKQRGYPIRSTGAYVSDPHFGNVLRTAIDLDFDLHPYDVSEDTMDRREYGEAANLAKLFVANPKLKLVVHVGYGHVYKTPDEAGRKMMAFHLWQMTGIEPYCIWQTFCSPDDGASRELSQLLKPGSDPMMLVPAPTGPIVSKFRFGAGAVDAIVVHPPSVGGPDQRVHSFMAARQRIAGVWNGPEWPVLIGAFKKGESDDAIALDQVMLRQGEKDFVLWIPHDDYEIRIFGMKGRVKSTNPDGSPALKMK